MSAAACPTQSVVDPVISKLTYSAFVAGWRAGMARSTTDPASREVIEHVATMLDASRLTKSVSRPE